NSASRPDFVRHSRHRCRDRVRSAKKRRPATPRASAVSDIVRRESSLRVMGPARQSSRVLRRSFPSLRRRSHADVPRSAPKSSMRSAMRWRIRFTIFWFGEPRSPGAIRSKQTARLRRLRRSWRRNSDGIRAARSRSLRVSNASRLVVAYRPEIAMRESRAATIKRAARISAALAKLYPKARISLNFETPWQCLAATILSAQATDAGVNLATPALFAEFPDARSMATANPKRVEQLIVTTGFFRQKTKSLIGAAQSLVEL